MTLKRKCIISNVQKKLKKCKSKKGLSQKDIILFLKQEFALLKEGKKSIYEMEELRKTAREIGKQYAERIQARDKLKMDHCKETKEFYE